MSTYMVSTFLLLCILRMPSILAQSTCSIGGATYMQGEALGDAFPTRCGSAQQFPCFCQPNAPSQVDCPYCGIATDDDSQGLACARVDGPFINITTLQGDLKECACRRDSTGAPETVCFNGGSNPNDNTPSTSPPSGSNGDVCTLEWADGSVDVFVNGESYGDLFGTKCGTPSDFPCFCNVSIPGKLYCPYCSVTNSTGGVSCGGIGETFEVNDENGQDVSCSCQDNLQADCSPVSSPISTPDPTLAPTIASSSAASSPTIRPLFVPSPTTPSPSIGQTTTVAPTLIPTVGVTTTRPPSVPLPTVDKPSILLPSRTPPVSIPVPGCSFVNETTGQEEFAAKGESLNSMQGPCSPLETFPVVCNPALPGGVEYPYCVFIVDSQTPNTSAVDGKSADTTVLCGKNGDQVQVPTTDGTIQSCSCLYLNPFIGAVSSCPDLILTIASVYTMTPNSAPSSAPNLLPGPVPNQGQPTISPQTPASALESSGHAIRQKCHWSLMTSMVAILSLAASSLFST